MASKHRAEIWGNDFMVLVVPFLPLLNTKGRRLAEEEYRLNSLVCFLLASDLLPVPALTCSSIPAKTLFSDIGNWIQTEVALTLSNIVLYTRDTNTTWSLWGHPFCFSSSSSWALSFIYVKSYLQTGDSLSRLFLLFPSAWISATWKFHKNFK